MWVYRSCVKCGIFSVLQWNYAYIYWVLEFIIMIALTVAALCISHYSLVQADFALSLFTVDDVKKENNSHEAKISTERRRVLTNEMHWDPAARTRRYLHGDFLRPRLKHTVSLRCSYTFYRPHFFDLLFLT